MHVYIISEETEANTLAEAPAVPEPEASSVVSSSTPSSSFVCSVSVSSEFSICYTSRVDNLRPIQYLPRATQQALWLSGLLRLRLFLNSNLTFLYLLCSLSCCLLFFRFWFLAVSRFSCFICNHFFIYRLFC